jgi:hypothetical protein
MWVSPFDEMLAIK